MPTDTIVRTPQLRLRQTGAAWPFAVAHAGPIARHWARRSAENPAFYDGEVLVLRELASGADGTDGVLSLERFSAFLYWRDQGRPDDATLDGFGSAIVRSAEGHVMVGRTATNTLNPGRVYLPGGFLDARDARPDGSIDIDASIARELREETGLDAGRLQRLPGYLVARHGRHCCFAIEWHSELPAAALVDRMHRGLAEDPDRELVEILVVREPADLERYDVLSHARFVIAHVLGGQPPGPVA